jgi:hypothetical protein
MILKSNNQIARVKKPPAGRIITIHSWKLAGKIGKPKMAAVAQDFPHYAPSRTGEGETYAHAQGIQHRLANGILGSKGFGPAQDQAVDHDQGNKRSQTFVQVRR